MAISWELFRVERDRHSELVEDMIVINRIREEGRDYVFDCAHIYGFGFGIKLRAKNYTAFNWNFTPAAERKEIYDLLCASR